MATIGDYIFLAIVIALIVAIYQGITRGSPALQESIRNQQEALKKSGINLSDHGVSIKTDKRAPSREEYIDSAQRAFSSAGEAINRHREAMSWGGPEGAQGGHRTTAQQFFGKRKVG
ncbi:hypothetical protein K437DRAFT_293259 [Tilletiaria anomala UBC 951]|uniref:Uncharacterized protein n=1 Tax=Tilletiaria anomala (strain ATCC 24038 / CBS 436.72 / UBC 951) TaxID=1037660 RepID=A0A066WMF8_TILAU|nr:uncharacterized protein K437DRAFT_293259 [Tilletiaria anomala UBC 951]KDN52189.1 hypothetical protein K437DRAFT_293259 [Tilletiaria anomala UBC 951]